MYTALVVTLVLVGLYALSSVYTSAVSTNSCACHFGRSQSLDILEGDAGNVVPTSINVGETKTVTVIVENTCTAAAYNTLSSVIITLASQDGRISVADPTFSIGTLSVGTATATWQITGVSPGEDSLLISATARNNHQSSLTFSDSYSFNPTIMVNSASPPPPSDYSVTITVTDSATSSPIQGATVEIGTATATTGSNGAASLTLGAGIQTLTIEKAGYQTLSQSITVSGSASISRSLVANPQTPPPPPPPPQTEGTYSVTVTVTDEDTGEPLEGAVIAVRGLRATTWADGEATLLLEAGKYKLRVVMDGYERSKAKFRVSMDTSLEIQLEWDDDYDDEDDDDDDGAYGDDDEHGDDDEDDDHDEYEYERDDGEYGYEHERDRNESDD